MLNIQIVIWGYPHDLANLHCPGRYLMAKDYSLRHINGKAFDGAKTTTLGPFRETCDSAIDLGFSPQFQHLITRFGYGSSLTIHWWGSTMFQLMGLNVIISQCCFMNLDQGMMPILTLGSVNKLPCAVSHMQIFGVSRVVHPTKRDSCNWSP